MPLSRAGGERGGDGVDTVDAHIPGADQAEAGGHVGAPGFDQGADHRAETKAAKPIVCTPMSLPSLSAWACLETA